MGTTTVALILYGDGRELGDFKIFASNLEKDLKKTYSKVVLKHVNRDYDFFRFLSSIPSTEKIGELHIFSHSIGAGLFLGYKDPAIAMERERVWRKAFTAARKVTYQEAVNTEVGAIQTDDLVFGKYITQKAVLRKKFTKGAFVKIWGCNSGIDNWIYSDGGVTDPADTTEPYYWRAFNERHVPKKSIAQAMAKYFNVKVYGAKSGASIEVKHKGKWVSTKQYKTNIGHWPSGTLPH